MHSSGGSIAPEGLFETMPVEMPTARPLSVAVDGRRVARALGTLACALVALSIVTAMTGVADRIFALDGERNVPAYFSTFVLLLAAGLLSVVAVLKKRAADRFALHWSGLAAIFLYLSLDEMVGLHEMSSSRIEMVVDARGLFYYASTIFTSTLVILFSIAFFKFALHLPRASRTLFFAAATLYVGGALGAELLEAMVDQARGTDNLLYASITTLEESLEMAGVILFVYALLGYLATELGQPSIRFTASPE